MKESIMNKQILVESAMRSAFLSMRLPAKLNVAQVATVASAREAILAGAGTRKVPSVHTSLKKGTFIRLAELAHQGDEDGYENLGFQDALSNCGVRV